MPARRTFLPTLGLLLALTIPTPGTAQSARAEVSPFAMVSPGLKDGLPSPRLFVPRALGGAGVAQMSHGPAPSARVRISLLAGVGSTSTVIPGPGAGASFGLPGSSSAAMILSTECLFQQTRALSPLAGPILPGAGTFGRPWGLRAGLSLTPFSR